MLNITHLEKKTFYFLQNFWFICQMLLKCGLYLQARNIRNLPIVNRDMQSIRFEEMQTEIKVRVKGHVT